MIKGGIDTKECRAYRLAHAPSFVVAFDEASNEAKPSRSEPSHPEMSRLPPTRCAVLTPEVISQVAHDERRRSRGDHRRHVGVHARAITKRLGDLPGDDAHRAVLERTEDSIASD